MKTILLLAALAGSLAAQTSLSTADGLFNSNFGFAIGGTNRLINIDASALNTLNIGDGTFGHTNGIVNLGVLNASSNISAAGAFFVGATAVTSGTTWIGNVSTSGTVATNALTTNTFQFAFSGSFSVSLESTAFNTLACGDSTLGHTNCILDVGVLNASTAVAAPFLNGTTFQIASSNVTSGSNWISGVAAGSNPVSANIIEPLAAIKTNFGGNNDTAGQLQLSATTPGVATYTFGQTYNATFKPICVVSDPAGVSVGITASSNTSFTVQGTNAHVVNYVCIGRT
jgi:hypothetical protein